MVAKLADVALEGDLELDQAGPADAGARRDPRGKLLSGPPEVSQPVVEQQAALAGQALRLIGLGIGANRPVEVLAERQLGAPLGESLVGGAAGVAHGPVDRDVAHERPAPVGRGDDGEGIVEGPQR